VLHKLLMKNFPIYLEYCNAIHELKLFTMSKTDASYYIIFPLIYIGRLWIHDQKDIQALSARQLPSFH
jgi:hypothetical protein